MHVLLATIFSATYVDAYISHSRFPDHVSTTIKKRELFEFTLLLIKSTLGDWLVLDWLGAGLAWCRIGLVMLAL